MELSWNAPRSPGHDAFFGNGYGLGLAMAQSPRLGQLEEEYLDFGYVPNFGAAQPDSFSLQQHASDLAYAKLMPSNSSDGGSLSPFDGALDAVGGKRALAGTESVGVTSGSKHPRYDSFASVDDDIIVTSGVGSPSEVLRLEGDADALAPRKGGPRPSAVAAAAAAAWGPVSAPAPRSQHPAQGAATLRAPRRSATHPAHPAGSTRLSVITEEGSVPSSSATPTHGAEEEEEEEEEEGEEGEEEERGGRSGGSGGRGSDTDGAFVVLPSALAKPLGRRGRIPSQVAYVSPGRLHNSCAHSVGLYGISNGQRLARLATFAELRGRRIFYKKVTYAARKVLSNGRVRVKGRFVKDPPGTMPPVL
jgi:hypothetical protein